jgi:Ca2+-binding RTX toxin-like protein
VLSELESTRTVRILLAALVGAFALLAIPLVSSAAAKTCAGKKVTIMGTPGDDVIVGKGASDVIHGGGGDDKIHGGRNGNDTICGGPGNDVLKGGKGYDSLYGDAGKDSLLGETGSDMLNGGGGDDELSGSKGADTLYGGTGADTLVGFKGPDELDGGPGDDFIDGEQGSDEIDGGPGEDLMHGDKGNDTMLGGPGDDRVEGGPGDDANLDGGGGSDLVVGGAGIDHADGGEGDGDVVRGDAGIDSLEGGAGSGDIVSYASATRSGVIVNLAAEKAKGDGHDELSGFEDVVGSPQGDTIVGNGEPNRLDGGVGDDTLVSGGGGGEAFGGPGTDSCDGFAIATSCGPEEPPPPGASFVILNQGLDGASLIIQGGAGNDSIRIGYGGGAWSIVDGGPIYAGSGCASPAGNQNVASCPGPGSLALVVVTGGAGNDDIGVEASVPANAKVRINGNAGNDSIVGGAGDDVLEAGENYNGPDNGNDTLVGNAGSDVLYSDPGADSLSGGAGNDLLVNSVPVCQGHRYDGGAGEDTVSYARSTDGVRATLNGTGGPKGCGSLDQILGSNESLEGSDGPDVLVGDGGANSFLGHLGADVFVGMGGNDFIDAIDGQRDKMIECGGGDDEVVRDSKDPRGSSC